MCGAHKVDNVLFWGKAKTTAMHEKLISSRPEGFIISSMTTSNRKRSIFKTVKEEVKEWTNAQTPGIQSSGGRCALIWHYKRMETKLKETATSFKDHRLYVHIYTNKGTYTTSHTSLLHSLPMLCWKRLKHGREVIAKSERYVRKEPKCMTMFPTRRYQDADWSIKISRFRVL